MAGAKGLLERFQAGENVVCAEGYLWELERRGFVTLGDFTPEVVIEHPERVKALYEEYVWAGSDVVVAYTYYAHREKLKGLGREVEVESLNMKALNMAREVADKHHCLMAGNLSNTTIYDPNDPDTVEKAKEMFKEQIQWAVRGGADYIIAETFAMLSEAKTALECIALYGNGTPAVVTLAAYAYDVTFEGVPLPEALRQLEEKGADVVGLNCGRGPETMLPVLEEALKVCKGPIAALPVCFRTNEKQKTFYSVLDPVDGKPAYPENTACVQSSRTDIRKFAERAKEMGVAYIGLCCGSSPSLLREVAMVYGREPHLAMFQPNLSRSFYYQTSEKAKKIHAFMFGANGESWP